MPRLLLTTCFLVIALAAEVACAAAPRGDREPTAAPDVLLVAAKDAKLRVVRVEERSLSVLYAVDLVRSVEDLVWVDQRTVGALLRGGRFVLVAEGRATPLALPPAKAWELPRPADATDAVSSPFPDGRERLLRVRGGTIWLEHCAWRYEGDSDPCAAWVFGRIHPPGPVVAKRPRQSVRAAEPKGSPAAGYAVRVARTKQGKQELRCSCRGRRGTSEELSDDACSTSVAVTWLGRRSRTYVAAVETDCDEGTSTTYVLSRACEEEPLATFYELAWGPAGVWAHPIEVDGEATGWTVRRNGDAVGTLKNVDRLRFRVLPGR